MVIYFALYKWRLLSGLFIIAQQTAGTTVGYEPESMSQRIAVALSARHAEVSSSGDTFSMSSMQL